MQFAGSYAWAKPSEASIRKDGKQRHIGTYLTAEEAALAYDKAAIQMHGQFANLNFSNQRAVQ